MKVNLPLTCFSATKRDIFFQKGINYPQNTTIFYQYRLVIFFAFMVFPNLSFAQSEIWENIDKEPVTLGIRQIIPQKYRIFRLNILTAKAALSRLPMEFTSAPQTLDIPMPDGSLQQFAVFESPTMEAELAKKFPEIKTYGGYSLSDKATTIRFDFTPKGFHGMILSPEGTVFIDPYSSGSTEYYISYDKKDFVTTKTFSCGGGII